MHNESADEHCHRRASRYAEHQRWEQRTAVLGVVGGFNRNNSFDSAFPELLSILRHLYCSSVCHKACDRSANARNHPDVNSDET